MATSFDLVTQPWIPVRHEGRLIEVSLEDALLRAAEFQAIEDQSPLVLAALHRFLLAVVHRALKGPEEVGQLAIWFRDGFPEGPIRAYLAAYQDRFDLFDPAQPFYQVPDFGRGPHERAWVILAAEMNSDNNKVLFDHTITARPEPLFPSQAARLLIANQAFALGGGRSPIDYTTDAPLATAATILVQRETLLETLCLNLAPYTMRQFALDRVPWERSPLTMAELKDKKLAERPPVGVVDRYTWQTRAIRLHPEEQGSKTIVTRISYASGVRCDDSAEIRDPLVAYRHDPKDAMHRYPIGFFRDGRSLWRDFGALLPTPARHNGAPVEGAAIIQYAGRLYEELALDDGETPQTVQIMILGQANNKAKIEFWRTERYQLPTALLRDPDLRTLIVESLTLADETGQRLNGAARALAKKLFSQGKRDPHKDDISRLVGSFPHGAAYWSGLERDFAEWLAGLGPADLQQMNTTKRRWLEKVERRAKDAWALTARSVGDDARALRAIFDSEGLLLVYLAKQRKEAA